VKKVSFIKYVKIDILILKILVQLAKNVKYCPLDCQAGGICVYIKSTPKCRCPKGRIGRLCESRMFTIHSISSTYSFCFYRFW
jgi:hypothetical protein